MNILRQKSLRLLMSLDMKPKVLVLRTAGTNCDKESVFAFESAGAAVDLAHLNYARANIKLNRYQIICLPGGFSYGDDLGAGKVFSLELGDWFKEGIISFLDKGGLLIGICNGFQVLVKAGILPDRDFKQKTTLTVNDSARFENRWVYLRVVKTNSVWLKGLPEIIKLPVAHGEGKFYAQKEYLEKIEDKGLVAFRYGNDKGSQNGYPFNPNGSLNGIAGITDVSGRILGLMPHPERCIFKHHLPCGKGRESDLWGLKIFNNAVNYFST